MATLGDVAVPQQARTGVWCKLCKEPVRLAGPAGIEPELQKAVHQGTGLEAGPGHGDDGTHHAQPTDEDPELRALADKLQAEFPDYRVTARFGILRAVLRRTLLTQGSVAVPYTARSGDEMRVKLRTAAELPPAPREGAGM